MTYKEFREKAEVTCVTRGLNLKFHKHGRYETILEISLMGRFEETTEEGLHLHKWYTTYQVMHAADAYEIYLNFQDED